MIYSSNLCHEIAQNMSESRLLEEEIIDGNGYSEIVQRVKAGDMVTCNLNSINLSKVKKRNLMSVSLFK